VPRPLREQVEDGIYHVYARGNRRGLLFRDDADYAHYLALLGGVVIAKRWQCLAYCLMPNHVHLLVAISEPNLARGIQHLHGLYAHAFNARYELSGHLFQGRYGSKPIRDDAQLLSVLRYIALNPVDGNLCLRAGEWPWDSYGAVRSSDAPHWLDVEGLFRHLSLWSRDPRRSYADLVSDALRVPA
jgi:REP element-mobilizing transposase RayT